MRSKWFEYKETAIQLRRQGHSMNYIERKFGIARSTLSGWFKKVKLSNAQKNALIKNSKIALAKARKKAILWHNEQKQKRIKEANRQAINVLENIDIENKHVLELALSILYLGEGSKTSAETNIGSSDPLILQFFISCLRKIYNFETNNIKCELHLRADQNPGNMKRFWAKKLGLPLKNFRYVAVDKRTIGTKTYLSYKGVCLLRCGDVSIQRRLLFLSHLFCKKVINLGS